MKLAIMQPYLFPYLGYFQLIRAADVFMLYGNSDYIDKGWVNRNRIGKRNTSVDLKFTVPVKRHSSDKSIRNTRIQYEGNDWQRVLLRQIYFNYCKSPYYNEVYPLIETCLQPKFETIAELNEFTIRRLTEFLSIETKIINGDAKYMKLESALHQMGTCGYRDFPEYEGLRTCRRTLRIIEICRNENCSHYLNPIGGQALYPIEEFEHYGVSLQFLRMHPVQYPSVTQPFLPNLSIIDVLMQNGAKKTQDLLNCYTLI